MISALILVDIQNDFLPGGSLAVPEGDQVVAVANRVQPYFEVIVATQDWHPADHGSFAANHEGKKPGDIVELDEIQQILWPVHAVQGTRGAAFSAKLETARWSSIVQKGKDPQVDSYSAFFDNGYRQATGMTALLRDRQVTDLYVMGLATDYCVKFSVLDGIAQEFRVNVIVDGCRGVDVRKGDSREALLDMEEAGARLISSSDLPSLLAEKHKGVPS